jgi:hypothetical protein
MTSASTIVSADGLHAGRRVLRRLRGPPGAGRPISRRHPGVIGRPRRSEDGWRQPLFEGLGDLHLPVTTRSETAQRYFDQGLGWRSRSTTPPRTSPSTKPPCTTPTAPCATGAARWCSAPTSTPPWIRATRPAPTPGQPAYELAQANGSDKEQALTAALLERYAAEAPEDRTPWTRPTPTPCASVAARFPDDEDILALTAEALMDLHPWDFWLADGEERPWTAEIIDTLERALALDRDHVGAIHLYIHAVEQSSEAHRAEPYADKLADLAPSAGHLVHMPAHIYIRIGRYHDATLNNMKATDADAAFIQACRSNSPIYLAGYIPHNWHFGWITAAIEGWSEQAFRMAEGTAARLTPELLRAPGMAVAQHFLMQPAFARCASAPGTRFSRAGARCRSALRPRRLALRPRPGPARQRVTWTAPTPEAGALAALRADPGHGGGHLLRTRQRRRSAGHRRSGAER